MGSADRPNLTREERIEALAGWIDTVTIARVVIEGIPDESSMIDARQVWLQVLEHHLWEAVQIEAPAARWTMVRKE
jgi:hypothetical protein